MYKRLESMEKALNKAEGALATAQRIKNAIKKMEAERNDRNNL